MVNASKLNRPRKRVFTTIVEIGFTPDGGKEQLFKGLERGNPSS
jgi:hypothetical protein